MNLPTYPIVLSLLLVHCGQRSPTADSTPTPASAPAGLDCDGPDQDIRCFFTNLPKDVGPMVSIAPPGEPGDRIIIRGRVLRADTKAPCAGAVLYGYHTASDGRYATRDTSDYILNWHGRLHGWCRTDPEGRYEIRSIRPGVYPSREAPAHIHAGVQLLSGATFWVNDFVFADDPLVVPAYLKRLREPHNPGEMDNGVVTLVPQEGLLVGIRDILVRE